MDKFNEEDEMDTAKSKLTDTRTPFEFDTYGHSGKDGNWHGRCVITDCKMFGCNIHIDIAKNKFVTDCGESGSLIELLTAMKSYELNSLTGRGELLLSRMHQAESNRKNWYCVDCPVCKQKRQKLWGHDDKGWGFYKCENCGTQFEQKDQEDNFSGKKIYVKIWG